MQLPGGLVESGADAGIRRRRDFAFRPLTGALEMALAETAESASSTPQAVTRALDLALARIGGEAPSAARIAALCVGDRQFLMRELERHLGSEGGWFQADCRHCGGPFDFRIDYTELPIQEAPEGFPRATVLHDGRELAFRLPTGADQEALLRIPEAEAPTWLMRRLALDADALPPAAPDLLAEVEAALDAVAPGIVLTVQSTCPQCGGDNPVDLDPYRALARSSEPLLQEIHQIAAHYHWSEADILALPRTRRQRYLQLIDRARGIRGD
jgi:hypothetical protein